MAVWADLVPDVLYELKGNPPQSLVEHHIKLAAIDFIARGGLMRKTSASFDLVGGGVEQVIPSGDIGTNNRLVRIESILYQGEPLPYKPVWFIESEFKDWKTQAGTPQYWTVENDGKFWVAPNPETTEAGVLKARFLLAPKRTAPGFDDFIFDKWGENISHGAKARLMAMKGAPWFDMNLAVAYSALFERAIEAAQLGDLKRAGKLETKPVFN
jgi:hypothetical protein